MRTAEAATRACGCDSARIYVVHEYLRQAFPDFLLRDLHAPTRLMQAGISKPQGEHHVVSMERANTPSYYAILLREFLECPVEVVRRRLMEWDVGQVIRTSRIAVVSKNGADAL